MLLRTLISSTYNIYFTSPLPQRSIKLSSNQMSSEERKDLPRATAETPQFQLYKSPNPNWTLGQRVDATEAGREWMAGAYGENAWTAVDPAIEDTRSGLFSVTEQTHLRQYLPGGCTGCLRAASLRGQSPLCRRYRRAEWRTSHRSGGFLSTFTFTATVHLSILDRELTSLEIIFVAGSTRSDLSITIQVQSKRSPGQFQSRDDQYLLYGFRRRQSKGYRAQHQSYKGIHGKHHKRSLD